jgi:uncharacterized membrane protein
MSVEQALKFIISLGVIEPQRAGRPVSAEQLEKVAEHSPRP